MTRRYKPTVIAVTREETRQLEMRREYAKAVRTPDPKPAEVEPAPQPEAGRAKPPRPKTVVIHAPIPAGTVVMEPNEARAIRRMFAMARETTTDPATRTRLRRAENELLKATKGPKL